MISNEWLIRNDEARITNDEGGGIHRTGPFRGWLVAVQKSLVARASRLPGQPRRPHHKKPTRRAFRAGITHTVPVYSILAEEWPIFQKNIFIFGKSPQGAVGQGVKA
jgi:hypothetical protein